MTQNEEYKITPQNDLNINDKKFGNENIKDKLLNNTNTESNALEATDPIFEEKFDHFLHIEDKTTKEYVNFFLEFSWMHFKKFFPVSIAYFLYMMINVMNIIMISHSKKAKEDDEFVYSVTLGMSLYYMLALSVCIGITSALDTFCTNSYGAKLYYLMGCYRNRALAILSLIYIPTAILMFFFKDILILMGQSEKVASNAGDFLRGVSPGVIFFYYIDINRRFLNAQGIFIPPIFSVIFTTIVHPLWIYWFFYSLDLGAFGVGLSLSFTNIIGHFLFILIVKKYSLRQAYFFINKDAFVGWKDFFSMAIPSMLMVCLETWNYQIINFMLGYLKDPTQENTSSYLISFSSIIYMFPFGLAVSATTIIGRLVGDFATKKTEIATKMIVAFSLVFSFIICLFLLIFKNQSPYMYTSKTEEIELMKDILWIYLIYAFFDIFTNSYAGIFRGLGMQKIISIVNFICYYLINLPFAYLLSFTCKWGIWGVWVSYIMAQITMIIIYGVIHFKRVDYYRICKEANKRLSRDSFIISANSDEKGNNTFINNSKNDDDDEKINIYNDNIKCTDAIN
jgi:MATE family multidrug resistance protein